MSERTCKTEGCEGSVTPKTARGMCKKHYSQWISEHPRERRGGEDDCRSDSNYPPADELVALMIQHGSMKAVARAVGVHRESLRDFLRTRPILLARMKTAREQVTPTPEQRTQLRIQKGREYMRDRRAQDPDGMRRVRREHMRSYGPEYRHRWNHYNRLRRLQADIPDEHSNEYAKGLRGDPCSYCGDQMQEIDHIQPLARNGDGAWDNLTAACSSCNRRKNDRTLLVFLLARLDGAA